MLERHNEILLGPGTGRDIKERIRVRVRGDRTERARVFHAHYEFFSFGGSVV